MNISICIPSYKRPKVQTLDYLPFAKVFVCETEFEQYREQNPGANIVACKKGIQGNTGRIRNHILNTEFDNGVDVVVMIDDDMKGMYRWVMDETRICKRRLIDCEEFLEMIEKYSTICKDLGFFYWGVNVNIDRMNYRECCPFSFRSFIGGPFCVFLKGGSCWYDERIPLKEDYDMTIQQCNTYRGCLRVNSIFYDVKQSINPGGCAAYRNMRREREQFLILQKKWGSKIVQEDKKKLAILKKQKRFDYNPVLKIPIKGV